MHPALVFEPPASPSVPLTAPRSRLRDVICDLLTLRCDAVSLVQLVEHFGSEKYVCRVLRELIECDFVRSCRLCSRWPLPASRSAVHAHRPGDGEPDFHERAYFAGRRWDQSSARFVAAYVATARLGNAYGVRRIGQLGRAVQATHELGLAGTYLHFLATRPDDAVLWRCQSSLAADPLGRKKKPDAYLMRGATVIRVIDFAGSYPASRLEAFHHAFSDLEYELW
jgi:hypothetical protein